MGRCCAAGFLFRAVWVFALLNPAAMYAAEVGLAGILGKKAVLVINGEPPRTWAVGQTTPEGVQLIEIAPSRDAVTVEINGVTQKLELGRGAVRVTGTSPAQSVLTLIADSKGHHFADGSINGAHVRFVVDTGATAIAIGMSDARRARIDLEKATHIVVQTASGPSAAWRVRFEIVKLGPLVMYGIDGLVMENDLPIALLGMSFLSRIEMQRDGDRMTLRRRY